MENTIENAVTGEIIACDIIDNGSAGDEPVLNPKVRATPLNVKCCYWCRGWKSAGVLPLRRDMGSFDNPTIVSGGICWKTQKGVFRFLCNLCNVTEIKAQLEKYRRTLL